MKTCKLCSNIHYGKGFCRKHMRSNEFKEVYDNYLAGHNKCEARFTGCTSDATQVHFKRGPVADLLIDVTYFIGTCKACAQWLINNINEARNIGYSVNKNI